MAGYGQMLSDAAYGVGDKWGAEWDRAMNPQEDPSKMMNPMFGKDPNASSGQTMNQPQLNSGGGFQKFMGMAKTPDMSKPQMQQGNDLMSLIQMLQGGQQPRGGRNARR
jgi:hypothetical protein